MSACDPALVACQISRLVDTPVGWDWNGFFATLIATMIGGALGVLGVWLGFRWQRRHQYTLTLDDAIVAVLQRLPAQATEIQRAHNATIDHYVNMASPSSTQAEPPAADHLSMLMLLEVAQVRARGEDQSIIDHALRAYEQIRVSQEAVLQVGALGILGGALSRWRSNQWTPDEVRASISRAGQFAMGPSAESSS